MGHATAGNAQAANHPELGLCVHPWAAVFHAGAAAAVPGHASAAGVREAHAAAHHDEDARPQRRRLLARHLWLVPHPLYRLLCAAHCLWQRHRPQVLHPQQLRRPVHLFFHLQPGADCICLPAEHALPEPAHRHFLWVCLRLLPLLHGLLPDVQPSGPAVARSLLAAAHPRLQPLPRALRDVQLRVYGQLPGQRRAHLCQVFR
mmetsp:Transcript_29509/g.74206  ORF Transcript_29509/g.74206 Transcript_29509/m.74206 type:complete len:203 (+) Transcript_29509:1777-2385(+)